MEVKIKEKHKYKVYVLYSTEDYKIRYVGSTNNLKKRMLRHFSDYRMARRCEWIHGVQDRRYCIRYKTVCSFDDRQDAEKKEFEIIQYLLQRGDCLVNSVGGKGLSCPSNDLSLKLSNIRKGIKWSSESKEKLKCSIRGRQSPAKGKKWSDYSKKKLSESKLGTPSNNRRRIAEYNKELVLLKTYDSITEAAAFNDCSVSNIQNCLAGRSKTANHKYYRYV